MVRTLLTLSLDSTMVSTPSNSSITSIMVVLSNLNSTLTKLWVRSEIEYTCATLHGPADFVFSIDSFSIEAGVA